MSKIKSQIIFIGLSLILLVVLGLALLYIPKGELHLLLCDRHTHARDIFYRYYTTLAEWFPYVVCAAILLFGRIGDGLFASSAMLLSALTTQILKHIVNAPRPVSWFAEHYPDIQLPLTEGVRMNYWFSFPSGHTTSFFALAFALSIIAINKLSTIRLFSTFNFQLSTFLVQLLLFTAATIGGYSRIYLSQHFTLDVFAGVLVGVLTTLICYVIFYRFQDKKWYNYRLLTKK